MSLGPENLPSPPASPSSDPLADVFHADDVDAHNVTADQKYSAHRRNLEPSQVAKVQRIHVTEGYREGVSASKGSQVQEGFDEGYPLGAELALRAGAIMGALEELNRAIKECLRQHAEDAQMEEPIEAQKASPADDPRDERNSSRSEASWWAERYADCQTTLDEARADVDAPRIFGQRYFDEDGLWTWDVHLGVDGGTATWSEVADAHPLLVKWRDILDTQTRRCGLQRVNVTGSSAEASTRAQDDQDPT